MITRSSYNNIVELCVIDSTIINYELYFCFDGKRFYTGLKLDDHSDVIKTILAVEL